MDCWRYEAKKRRFPRSLGDEGDRTTEAHVDIPIRVLDLGLTTMFPEEQPLGGFRREIVRRIGILQETRSNGVPSFELRILRLRPRVP